MSTPLGPRVIHQAHTNALQAMLHLHDIEAALRAAKYDDDKRAQLDLVGLGMALDAAIEHAARLRDRLAGKRGAR